jgi:uncharacterized Zn-binding protein involved in type VI secretion
MNAPRTHPKENIKTITPESKIKTNYTAPQQTVPRTAQPQSLPNKITNMFKNKQKWPVLAAFFLAFILGALGYGFIGLILGVAAGLFLLTRMGNYKLTFKPWQTAVNNLLPIIAKMLFWMVFLLPIADYMTMPSGHSPDSLVKYVSIMFAAPQNIISGSPTDVYPGIPIIVLISVILMVWGGISLNKKKGFAIALGGLLLYTLSPTIASFSIGQGRLAFIMEFYGIGFYLAWTGLILLIVSKFLLPKILKTPQNPDHNVNFAAFVPLILAPFFISYITTVLSQALIVVTPMQLEFESAHHTLAGFLAAIFGGLGAGSTVDEEEQEDPDTLTLELTYPAGRSPNVFTTGWLFGARAILNQGKPNEEDVSDQVQWSGSGSFEPSQGSRSRPSFNSEGPNTIILKVDTKSQGAEKTINVNAVSPAGFAAVGDKAQCPADAHGCPACPHPVVGPIISGSPNVLINGRPAARLGDPGTHAACCGPNTFTITSCASRGVLIDGKPAAHLGDQTTHCGGTGQIIEGA